MAAHLDTDVKKIPPLGVLSESLIQVEYMFQRVSRGVEHPIQPKWDFIHALLDILTRLGIEPHAPAFKQNDV
jgi:hypothetical protein